MNLEEYNKKEYWRPIDVMVDEMNLDTREPEPKIDETNYKEYLQWELEVLMNDLQQLDKK